MNSRLKPLLGFLLAMLAPCLVRATPANKAALERHFDRFLVKELNRCATCHLPSDNKAPESLEEFPHNPFGHRLRLLGHELDSAGRRKDIPSRLELAAREDSDGDGVENETELLLGHNPGDAKDTPTKKELAGAKKKRTEFAAFLASYRWQPFDTVQRPAVPSVKSKRWGRNPIDALIAAEHESRRLQPRPEASREVLLRRVYLDLIGLSPTSEEQLAFAEDRAPDAYEKVVNTLLRDPRYGERWGRHWMDVWRYSDWAGWTDGGQIRDSKPHIWRWRDWIVESLNKDKGYDQMVLEMLAADELAPEDTDALRATGFLARNYKMLSREAWLEDTVKHTSQAFLGLTVGCAKCHNHMYDPISQKEYYQLRAVFEPHQVRIDRVPGQLDTAKDGLVRVFDTETNRITHLLLRGDERHPDTNKIMVPGVPLAMCGLTSVARSSGQLNVEAVDLPRLAAMPDKREFVLVETIAASEKALADAREALAKWKTNGAARPEKLREQELNALVAETRHKSLLATVRAEKLEENKSSDDWKEAAMAASTGQRQLAVLEAKLKVQTAQLAQLDAQSRCDETAKATNAGAADKEAAAGKGAAEKAAKELEAAKKKTTEAEKALAAAEKDAQAAPATSYKPRSSEVFPGISTGRRLAFARWVANRDNPLTARVAVNHIWLRHFGRGLVPTPADFGRNGRPPSHPQLLDWLAAELMAQGWSMKAMHRLMVTSSTYRMASTTDERNASLDPDNIYLWRMNSHRLEAEAVRDNLLYVSDALDATMGGPDIDHKQGLTSKRRSLYLRIAAEKEVEFLKIFDGPSVTECYERKPSVVPQQALALANSELALSQSRRLAARLWAGSAGDSEQFLLRAFQTILARQPKKGEMAPCRDFLEKQAERASAERARENLILVFDQPYGLRDGSLKPMAAAWETGRGPVAVPRCAREDNWHKM